MHYQNTIREKPETAEECRQYLRSYATSPAVTVTSVIVTNCKTGCQASGVDVATQYFKPLPEPVIDQLIAQGDVMHCCGGFLIDDPLVEPYLDRLEGERESIIGLPITLTRRLLAEADQA